MLGEQQFETPVFKLAFSHIKCKINLQDSSILAIAVKIGKVYSKFTAKKQLKNSYVEFNESITIPVNENLVFDKNPRKQKCQIMVYRYSQSPKKKQSHFIENNQNESVILQKQNKNLLGMASVSIVSQLFQQKSKKIRITNTFDKDAFAGFNVKISHDIFHQNDEKISSIGSKSQVSSMNEQNQNKKQKNLNDNSQISWIQHELNSKYKNRRGFDLGSSRLSEQNKPISTKQLGSYSQRQNNYEQIDNCNKRQKLFSPKNQKSLGRIKRNDNSYIHYYSQREVKDNNYQSHQNNQPKQLPQPKQFNQPQQNNQLFQLCNNLQDQNKLLMNKILYLESHIFNKNQNNETQPAQNIRMIKSLSQAKPSMIKKNMKFTTSISTTVCSKQLGPKYEYSNMKEINNLQKIQQKQKGKKNQELYSFRPSSMMISIKQTDNQLQNSKSFTPKSFAKQKQFFNNQQSHLPFTHTASQQLFGSRFKALKINPVITIAYIPPVQSVSNQNSRIQKSISQSQRSFTRSYTKFNDKKKYLAIGVVKKPQTNQFCKNSPENKQIISPKNKNISQINLPHQYNNLRIQTQENNEFPINVKVNGLFMGFREDQCKQKFKNDKQDKLSDKSTLQDVNMLIEQKYRKQQNILKKANDNLLQQNKNLKIKYKWMEVELQEKKSFTVQQFNNLKTQSTNQKIQIQRYSQKMINKQLQIQRLQKKLKQFQEQNMKLKKDLRDQKMTVSYFIKTSRVNDQKQKQQQQIYRLIQQHQLQLEEQKLSQIALNSPKRKIQKQKQKQFNITNFKIPINNSIQLTKKQTKGYQTQRTQNPRIANASKNLDTRLSVTKLMTQRNNVNADLITYSSSQLQNDKQKSVSSKALIGLKQRSNLQTKRTLQQSRFNNVKDVQGLNSINQRNENSSIGRTLSLKQRYSFNVNGVS